MKYVLAIMATLLLTGCSVDRSLEAVVTAKDGVNGTDGKNGYSIVSQTLQSSELECEISGTRLDMYLDLDYSLSVTEGDIYTNSLVVCNGRNGLQGQQGIQGERGPRGQKGPRGLQGVQGIQGILGMQGPVGETGSAGAMGPQGEQGISGPQGPTGPQGPQGLQGPQGTSGTNSASIIRNYGSSACTRIVDTNSYVKPTGSNNFALYTSSSCSSNTKYAEISDGEAYWASSNTLATWVDGCLRTITFN